MNTNGTTRHDGTWYFAIDQIVDDVEQAKPINFSERLEFIIKNTHNYTSFRQLEELFKETKKKIARLRVQLKDE